MWVVVPCLKEGRDQLDHAYPNREHGAEGFIGDLAHQGNPSSHNPDESGKPEFSDNDDVDEVRAWDIDRDLHAANGLTLEDEIQRLIQGLRAGKFWWIRYIIYKGRIWHRRDNFVTRTYTGSNKHDDHAHVNSDFTQTADGVTGTDWEWASTSVPTNPSTPPADNHVVRLGAKGEEVGWIQQFFRDNFPAYRNTVSVRRGQLISVDKDFGQQTQAWVKEFQRRTFIHVDGEVGPQTRGKMRSHGYKH